MYDFQRIFRAPRDPSWVSVASHQCDKIPLCFPDRAVRTLDLDKSRLTVKPTEQQVGKPLRQALHAAQMDENVLMERRVIDALTLPEIACVRSKNNPMRGQRDADLILDVGFR